MSSSTPIPKSQLIEIEQIYRFYIGLIRAGLTNENPESGLGGRLLYAGEPDEAGTHLLRAANIAGAASLAVSADAQALRCSMREGAIDFQVSSLDEALRILKNEIRKRQPVAVGVSVAPSIVTGEMLGRGVVPDLIAPALAESPARPKPDLDVFAAQGALVVEPAMLPDGVRFIALSIPEAWRQKVAEFDALLENCLPPNDHANRRWLCLSPRYLPASARRLRTLACDDATAQRLTECMNRTPR